ncbi:MAG: InlB B-repeat-containing protein [Acholeplasmatales bacterium]|nr:InlB B-repeat-containing protein [Acholeplasmatales bacterium]
MRKFNKLLYIIPFILLIVGCSKKSITTNKKTTNVTTKEKTTVTTVKTTTKPTTTEKKFEVKVSMNKEEAATITGVGKFSLNSNTTITISTNEGYVYEGLYDGENLLTNETTYNITNITKDINLNAKFSAETFNLTSTIEDDTYGDIEVADGAYECGSTITLKAMPITGYKLEGWYIDGVYLNDKEETTIKMPAKDIEIQAKFVIQTFTLTITDNIKNKGEYEIDEYNEYTGKVTLTYEYDEDVSIYVKSVEGYHFDHCLVNGEYEYYSYFFVTMLEDVKVEVFYEINEYTLNLSYSTSVVVGKKIVLVNEAKEIVTNDKTNGAFAAIYNYNSVASFKLYILEDYTLNNLVDSYYGNVGTLTKDKAESIYTFALTMVDNYYLTLDVTGRMCTVKALCEEEEGYVTITLDEDPDTAVKGTGEFEYGHYVSFTATSNTGYRFVKWVSEDGYDLEDAFWSREFDNHPEIIGHWLTGNATIKAIFTPDTYLLKYYKVSPDGVKEVYSWGIDYLTNYTREKLDVDGYTFVGWLESEDSTEVYSTEDSITFKMPHEDKNIYAYYTQNEYTITIDNNGGTSSVPSSVKMKYGDIFDIEEPTLEGLSFTGYLYYQEYAKYDVDTDYSLYIVDYMNSALKIGYADGYVNTNHVFKNGEVATETTRVTRGDVIEIEAHLTGIVVKIGERFEFAYDIKVAASWKCRVTFYEPDMIKVRNEVYVEVGATTYNPGTPQQTKTGYTFNYWECNGERFDFSAPITENLIIIPHFDPNSYKVTLTGETGLTVSGTNLFTEGNYTKAYCDSEITLTVSLKDGNYFDYWKNMDTEEVFYNSSITFKMPAHDVRYKAFSKCYPALISVDNSNYGYIDNGGYVYLLIESPTTIVAHPNDGYGFDGWYENGELISSNPSYDLFADPEIEAIRYITAVFGKCACNGYERFGDKIYFGTYPQTLVTDSALNTQLYHLSGTLPDVTSADKYDGCESRTDWTLYSNYRFTATKTEEYKDQYGATQYRTVYYNAPLMWYKDIDVDGDRYRGVIFFDYRNNTYSQNSGPYYSNSNQYDNSYYPIHFYPEGSDLAPEHIYFFKYEQIEWDIISETDDSIKIIANLVLDSQEFYETSQSTSFIHNGQDGYSNNYKLSNIRKWLNNNFYNTAFNDLEKEIMEIMTVDNSKSTTSQTTYECANTSDLVTLLSYTEAEAYYGSNNMRCLATDYAKCQGVLTDYSGHKYATWLLRSPYSSASKVSTVNASGSFSNINTNYTNTGIRPVVTIIK